MKLHPSLYAATLAALVAGSVWAQDSSGTAADADTTTDNSAETAAPADQPAADDGDTSTTGTNELAMGEDAESGLGQPYAKEQIGDWSLQCVKTEGEEDPCQMYQLLADSEGNAVSEFTLFRLPDGQQAIAGAMIAVPLETLLTSQLTITVDGGKGRRYPFMFCNTVGCYARVGFTKADIAAFKRGNVARMSIVPMLAPDQKVTVELSLKGFTKAYDKVSVVQQ